MNLDSIHISEVRPGQNCLVTFRGDEYSAEFVGINSRRNLVVFMESDGSITEIDHAWMTKRAAAGMPVVSHVQIGPFWVELDYTVMDAPKKLGVLAKLMNLVAIL